MCGIVCAIDLKGARPDLRAKALQMAGLLRHRGPDWSGVWSSERAILAHERLAIVDPASGRQPLLSPSETLVLAVNGEIYNHLALRSELKRPYPFRTQSDCEVLLPLYQEHGPAFLPALNGIFAFVLHDEATGEFLVARDHLGIVPLYMGTDREGVRWFASELKALEGVCNRIEIFPPGHYLTRSDAAPVRWYRPRWQEYGEVAKRTSDTVALRAALEAAVHRQLMCDVPYGVLLSGGLDSSVISAIAKKHAAKRVESGDRDEAWWPRLHSFSIGLAGSPDLAAARDVAAHIGTVHHEVVYTIQEGLDAVRDVIYHLETYDITTIRAATPMYLLARVIRSMGIKMVLSGEGSDELFGGYLYFHKAPSARALHEETVRKLDKLHLYDCLRANKALAAFGVEGRVPFLDREFVEVAMHQNPADKMSGAGRMEKFLLRTACEDLLPKSVAWRQKEQFSDGVGYGWIDSLRALAEEEVSAEDMALSAHRFPFQPPRTKEEYRYRRIFEEHFPSAAAAGTVPSVPSVACSSETALEWDASFKNRNEPSGRAVAGVHREGYNAA